MISYGTEFSLLIVVFLTCHQVNFYNKKNSFSYLENIH